MADIKKYLSYEGLQDVVGNIKAVAESKQDVLTGTSGQTVGFDADGKAVAQDSVQSDWTQIDESKPDFIKNKLALDSTLSVSGAAADAKAVGDALVESKLQAETYTDNAVAQKTQVQIITWEEND